MSEVQLFMLERPKVRAEVLGWLIHASGLTEAVRGMHLSGTPIFCQGRFFLRYPDRMDLLVDGRGHIAYTTPEYIVEDTCTTINLRLYGIVETDHKGLRDPMGRWFKMRPAVYSLDALLGVM